MTIVSIYVNYQYTQNYPFTHDIIIRRADLTDSNYKKLNLLGLYYFDYIDVFLEIINWHECVIKSK